MKLMDYENGRLRKQVHAKEKRKAEKKGTTQAHARLMTGAENLNALAEQDFMKRWKEVMKELAPIFKRIRKEISDDSKAAAAAVKKAARGRGRGGQRGGGKSRGRGGQRGGGGGKSKGQGRGRGRGRGRGKGRLTSLEEESEGGASSSNESSDNGKRSESSESGEEDQSGGVYEDAAADIPPSVLTPPIQPVRPRPAYRMIAPAVVTTDSTGHSGSQPQIGGVPIIAGTVDGTGTAAECENAVENEHRYPRRSNRTKLRFVQGIDA
ncbi:hypothetical protein JOM56_014945 [Amanita muscaria]